MIFKKYDFKIHFKGFNPLKVCCHWSSGSLCQPSVAHVCWLLSTFHTALAVLSNCFIYSLVAGVTVCLWHSLPELIIFPERFKKKIFKDKNMDTGGTHWFWTGCLFNVFSVVTVRECCVMVWIINVPQRLHFKGSFSKLWCSLKEVKFVGSPVEES